MAGGVRISELRQQPPPRCSPPTFIASAALLAILAQATGALLAAGALDLALSRIGRQLNPALAN